MLEWSGFQDTCSPTLGPNDVVICVLGTEHNDAAMVEDAVTMAKVAASQGAKLGLLTVGRDITATGCAALTSLCDAAVHLVLPAAAPSCIAAGDGRHGNFLAEIGVKLVLNAVTTGGHIMKGKIFSNRMIDLQVSNNKLYYRTIGIVSACSGHPEAQARTAVLRALYGVRQRSRRTTFRDTL